LGVSLLDVALWDNATGAKWTIDVPKKILGTGTKGFEELKFRP
jgi:hypothetical protein